MAKECRSRLKPCTLALYTYSFTHNEDGHKAMIAKGIDVSPDRLPTVPQGANNTNNSKTEYNVPQGKLLALAKKIQRAESKAHTKTKRKKEKSNGIVDTK